MPYIHFDLNEEMKSKNGQNNISMFLEKNIAMITSSDNFLSWNPLNG